MFAYLVRKLLQLIPTLLGVSLLSFILVRLVPGDPVLLLLGERGGDPQLYAQMQKNLGLDLPYYQQYFRYLSNALSGDLGTSIVSKRPVMHEFFSRFPATLELSFFAMFFAILFGIPLGVYAAVKRNTKWDFSLMGVALVGYSMPIFWWGLILILIFSVQLGITPVAGRISAIYDIPQITGFYTLDSFLTGEGFPAFFDSLRHLLLPACAMGTIPMAVIARMTRSSMLEVLGEDYIRTARAKGVPRKVVIFHHALKNALIPIITAIGLLVGSLITGAILTESIFSWPGIGKWMVAAVNSRDYPVIQGGVLIIAFFIVFINSLVDFTYFIVNPRMRTGGSSSGK